MVCKFCGLPMDDCSCHASAPPEEGYISEGLSYQEAFGWMDSDEEIRKEAEVWADQFCDKPVEVLEDEEFPLHEYLSDLMEVRLIFSHSVDNVLQALKGLLQMPAFLSKDESKIAQSEFFKELNDVFLKFVSGVADLTNELENSPSDCDCEDCQNDS